MSLSDSKITIFGHGSGHPSMKNLNTYTSQRAAAKGAFGKNKGVVEVRRLKTLTDEQREKAVKKYKTILGRNEYNQSRRSYCYKKYKDGKYYSDCSSSGILTLKEIGVWKGSTLNTAGIHSNDLWETVPVEVDSKGHIKDCTKLKIFDAILYRGSDAKRPLGIGHVEWVAGIDDGPTTVKSMTTTGKLNMRSEARKVSMIKAVIPKNTTVEITGKSSREDSTGIIWVQIKYKSMTGWCSSKYMK